MTTCCGSLSRRWRSSWAAQCPRCDCARVLTLGSTAGAGRNDAGKRAGVLHTVHGHGIAAAEALLTMEFKKGRRLAVPPRTFPPADFAGAPAQLRALDAPLAAATSPGVKT